MKLIQSPIKYVFALAILLVAFNSCKEKEADTESTEDEATAVYTSEATDDDCTCGADWFPHNQTPNPPEGVGSPFDSPTTTNCIFHQWSWQKFLYLTKNGTESYLFYDETTQVDKYMAVVPQVSGAQVALSDTAQAGSGGVLKSNPNYGTSASAETVYYSIHVNDIMYDASQEFVQEIISDSTKINNDFTFPIGSLELKVAYVSVNSISSEELANYATVMAVVGDSQEAEEMAILGVHVVGIVINHPEFIWATFEHESMAPKFDWTTMTASASSQNLFFAEATTDNLNGIRWGDGSPKTADQAFMLFKYGVPTVQGGDYMSTSQSEPTNFNNIDDLNKCAQEGLADDVWSNYFLNGALWLDTDGKTLEQQVALIDSLAGNLGNALPKDFTPGFPGDYARGSVNEANLTMETYVQEGFKDTPVDSINVTTLFNCMHCHIPVGSGSSPLYISHIFDGLLSQSKGSTPEEIEKAKTERFLKVLEARKN